MTKYFDKLFISIVIPLYNKESSCWRSIKSVLRQTVCSWELIIINDGSTDRSREVVSEIILGDERIRIIDQVNMGVSAARNRGIKESKYEWIAFIDADDEWNASFIENILEVIHDHKDAEVVYTGWKYSNVEKTATVQSADEPVCVFDYFDYALRDKTIWSSCVAIQKKCFTNILFPVDEKINEDTAVWVQLAWTGKKIYFIPSELAVYHACPDKWKQRAAIYFNDRRPIDKLVFKLYSDVLMTGMIPKHMQKNAAKYFNLLYLDEVLTCIDLNNYLLAWLILVSKCHLSFNFSKYCKNIICLCVPRFVYLYIRR